MNSNMLRKGQSSTIHVSHMKLYN